MMIRPVESRDTDAWSVMRARLWPEAAAPDLARETLAFVTRMPETILAAAFIAQDDQGEPVGFIEIALRQFSDGCDSMPVPHIEGWYVEASARGRGVGRSLMEAAETWARTAGFKETASDTEVHNETSHRAHQACGFVEVDRLIKFRKELG